MRTDTRNLVEQMTLEEKAGFVSGADFWRLKGIERLGIPSVMVSDGPHGLRKQDEGADHLGINDSIVAVCFPAGCATASSFDRDLIREMGEVIGHECQAEDLSVVLGPAVNIKRSPLCGRNFEYLSEDPYLAGEMAASYIKGVQSRQVGTSIKHFALNNQEHERMSGSSECDERTMREIYLPAFETAVKEAQPWTVMCSYNRVNGTYASENKSLLTDILRDEWGFEGLVVSDWGAVNDRVKGILAGMDLEMPGGNPTNTEDVLAAVRDGSLPEEKLDEAVGNILDMVLRYTGTHAEEKEKAGSFSRERDHERSASIAEECMVLLKNEDGMLPLRKGAEDILFVGGFAEKPRFQGGGSSHINSWKVEDALTAARTFAPVAYAQGFPADRDEISEELFAEALAAAEKAGKVVIFAGLPDSFESEGYDRTHMRLPECQNQLIEKICAVNSNVAVVLHNGSPVEMPWIGEVRAVLEAYLGGEAGGRAVSRLLFGEANPSGKLAETFPLRLEDTPCYLDYPGKQGKTFYREGIFVGYRYYDSRKMEVLFPFGHGLSYTTFAYDDLKVKRVEDGVEVRVKVTNTGTVPGKEVVQVYVSDLTDTVLRPMQELKGFEKVLLAPGQSKTVTVLLKERAFACWDEEASGWCVPAGNYEIRVGSSSRDIRCSAVLPVDFERPLPFRVHTNTTFGELQQRPELAAALGQIIAASMSGFAGAGEEKAEDADQSSVAKEAVSDDMMAAMLRYMPLRAMRSFGNTANAEIEKLVQMLNAQLKK